MSRMPFVLLLATACELTLPGAAQPDATLDADDRGDRGDGRQPDEPRDPRPGQDGDVLAAEPLRAELLDRGMRAIPAPPPVSDALFTLGQALSFDPILSGNRDIACLSCHHPDVGTDDDLALPLGVDSAVIPRNAPALFNLHAQDVMFWDNRVRERNNGSFDTPAGNQLTPEMEEVFTYGVVSAQAMFPVTSREEMRGEVGDNELADLADDDFTGIWDGLMVRLRANPTYVTLLTNAYPNTPVADMSFAHAANAIAAFEIDAFASRGSPYERFLAGDDSALSAAQRAGAQDFIQDGCTRCHRGEGLSDFQAHNTGLPQIGPGHGDGPSGLEDYGTSGNGANRYAFRTPALTNTTLTGPWGHAGQYDDLGRFIRHYQNVEQQLLGYDVQDEVGNTSLWTQHFDGSDQAILQQLDRDLRQNRQVDEDSIEVFMEALEDPAATSLSWTVPGSVPSGLPVAP